VGKKREGVQKRRRRKRGLKVKWESSHNPNIRHEPQGRNYGIHITYVCK